MKKTRNTSRILRPPTSTQKVSQSTLAHTLGVSRQLISAHAKKPDAPPISDTLAWKEFLASAGRTGSLPTDLRRRLGEERLRMAQAKADLVEHERDAVTGDAAEAMPRAQVETLLRSCGWLMGIAVRQSLRDCALRCAHLSSDKLPGELWRIGSDAVGQALAALGAFPGSPPAWSFDALRASYGHPEWMKETSAIAVRRVTESMARANRKQRAAK
jgi:hypothetical protein